INNIPTVKARMSFQVTFQPKIKLITSKKSAMTSKKWMTAPPIMATNPMIQNKTSKPIKVQIIFPNSMLLYIFLSLLFPIIFTLNFNLEIWNNFYDIEDIDKDNSSHRGGKDMNHIFIRYPCKYGTTDYPTNGTTSNDIP